MASIITLLPLKKVCKLFKTDTMPAEVVDKLCLALNTQSCDQETIIDGISMSAWFASVGITLPKDLDCQCAKHGWTQILQWLFINKYPKNNEACTFAAKFGYLDVLVLLLKARYVPTYETLWKAAKYGQLQILMWLSSEGCELDSSLLIAAVQTNNLPMTKWLLHNDCRCSSKVPVAAARAGSLTILAYLEKKGYLGMERGKMAQAARENQQIETLKWLELHDYPMTMHPKYCDFGITMAEYNASK
jgi:hypothetical protein